MSLSPNHQSCEKCFWATYAGKTQDGCKLGYVDKFRLQDRLVEAANEEREFYIVNAPCRGFRPLNWSGAGSQPNNLEKENEVKVTLVVLDGEGLEHTLQDILTQSPLPFQVLIVTRSVEPETHALVWSILGNRVTWRLLTVAEDCHEYRLLDIVFPSCQGEYYLVVEPGKMLPQGAIGQIDQALNNDLKHFLAIRPKFGLHGLCVHAEVHRQMDGNYPQQHGETICYTILEKLELIAAIQENPGLVQTWEGLCLPA